MNRRRFERFKSNASLVVLLMSLPFLFPTSLHCIHGTTGLPQTLIRVVSGADSFHDLYKRGAGAGVLPRRVRVSAAMLAEVDAHDFYCSKKLQGEMKGTGLYQRLLEGVYPIKFSEASEHVFLSEHEAVPRRCRALKKKEGVQLASCSP